MSLDEYRKKRRFSRTPEPAADPDSAEVTPPSPHKDGGRSNASLRFVVQKHDATRLHYDLRLELNGVLKSWAVPQGPSLDTNCKRLAIHVEDHPLEYLQFEGVIPRGEYGGGTVLVWDLGKWSPRGNAQRDYERGELKFDLFGEKLNGGFMLLRLGARGRRTKNASVISTEKQNQWLLIKERDAEVRIVSQFDVLSRAESVLTGRNLDEVASDRNAVWSARTATKPAVVSETLLDPFRNGLGRYPQARAKPLPETARPSLPTASQTAPIGAGWVHEIKHDGYRMLCRRDGDDIRFTSRNGKDWTNKVGSLQQSVAQLTCKSAILDGEVVVMTPDGHSNFHALQTLIGGGRDSELRYFLFDLLYLDGYDLTRVPLLGRKELLHQLVQAGDVPTRLLYSEHMSGHGPDIFHHARELGVEGIVSKRLDKPYIHGRTDNWKKTKCLLSREFVIGGYTPPTASRQGLGAILLGGNDAQGRLRFVGKVGTGFTQEMLVSIRSRLEAIRTTNSPFVNLDHRNADKGTVWVTPELIAEIEFGGWTTGHQLRFGSFRGIRDDVSISDVDLSLMDATELGSSIADVCDNSATKELGAEATSAPEEPTSRNKVQVSVPTLRDTITLRDMGDVTIEPSLLDLPPELASLRLTHPERLIYPEIGITKLGIATYYAQVGRWMLPHLVGRPLSLLRCPEGVGEPCFFQKRAPQGLDSSVQRVELPTNEGSREFLVVRDLVGLLSLVQFGVLEFHVRGDRSDRPDSPDRLVFDLDPDNSVPWEQTVSAAMELREWLQTAGLVSFLKTSGGKGLHILVPIRRRHPWAEAKEFTQKVASVLVGRFPKHFTTNTSKRARQGKILIDVLRNTRGATTVAPYSTRAHSKAAVSVPLAWHEAHYLASSDSIGLQAVIRRLAHQVEDPWYQLGQVDQGLTKEVWTRIEKG